MAFDKDGMDEIHKKLKEQGILQDKINTSVSEYTKHLREIAEIQANIKHITEQQSILKEEEATNSKKLKKLQSEELKGTKKEISERKKEIKLLKEKLGIQRAAIGHAETSLEILRETNDEFVEAAQHVNKINMGLKAGGAIMSKFGGFISKGFGKLKGTGIFDMDKAIRMAGVEMGIVSSTGKGLGVTLEKAADQTVMIGVGLKDLAKIQGTYSAQLGRSVQLSQEGLEAMAEIANGTMLGAEGAGALVAEMDRFNISATDSRDLIEETVNMSAKMGINSGKVLKNLQNNLKMANKYHFKGGVKGMVSMAASAAKLNVDMSTTAGFADKLFDIEGAVEMSAKLNTMGGEWAKLGDPMKLMYQARNDMEGLQDSLANATAGMADFNSETGEFSFSGLELHRMRELEKITGISAEQMAEMAKSKAKFAKIDSQLGGGVTDEMKEFIESTATFNKKSGEFEIKLTGKDPIPVDELNASHEKMMKAESVSLKKRAEESQTFDDTLKNTIDLFKQAMLPVLEGLNASLPAIKTMIKEMKSDGIFDGIKSAARTIGKVVGGAISFLSKFPKLIGAAIIGIGLLKPLMWIANGLALSKGFMMGTKGMMGGGRGGVGGGVGGRGGGQYRDPKTGRFSKAPKMGMGKRMLGGNSKFRAGSVGSMGLGMGLGVGAMGLDLARGEMDNPDSTGGKWMGVGSSALAGAGMGAMLGPIGAAVGGLLGGIYGAVTEFNKPTGGSTGKLGAINDGILADGKITSIDSKDKVFEISKPGGAYDKAANSNPSASAGGGGGTHKIHISFDDITIKSNDGDAKIDLSTDSAFIRELATKIKESLSISANGGVLNPNPST